jgi:hypothetical protein
MALNEKLRAKWKAIGYERGHGSDAVMPPPPTGFKRLYYLTSADHAISNVAFGRIKVSRFAELNDPFELLGQNFGDADIRRIVRKHKDQFNETKGIICFSEDWTDPVLWSHYASKHKGVALGFDVREDSVKNVNYSERRLKQKLPPGVKSITSDLEDLLIYTKFSSWSYEREFRMVVDLDQTTKEGGLHFVNFDKNIELKEFIIGSTCDMNLKKTRAIVNNAHNGVYTYQARLAYKAFRIIPKGSSVVQI